MCDADDSGGMHQVLNQMINGILPVPGPGVSQPLSWGTLIMYVS